MLLTKPPRLRKMYGQPPEKNFESSQHPQAEDYETLLPRPRKHLQKRLYPRPLLLPCLKASFLMLILLVISSLGFWVGRHSQSNYSSWVEKITNYCQPSLLNSHNTSDITQHQSSKMFLSPTPPLNSMALYSKKTSSASLRAQK